MDKILLIILFGIFYFSLTSNCKATPAQGIRIKKSDYEYLTAHNEARAKKGLPPLAWSKALKRYSKQWAKHLATDGKCRISHSDTPRDYGENLAQWWGGTIKNGRDAVAIWMSEEKYYDYSTNTCEANKQCGHYTQIVWRDTREVGCSTYQCPDSGKYSHSTIHVCQYYPPGNWVGKKPY